MKDVQINITIQECYNLKEFPLKYQNTIGEAVKALDKSYSPYSKFAVGAALLMDDGSVIQGNNQENAAYPSGLCAERVAMFYANSCYPEKKVVLLAIVAKTEGKILANPISPCGACRQVLLESEQRQGIPFKIILYGTNVSYLIDSSKSLLPLSFSGEQLGK